MVVSSFLGNVPLHSAFFLDLQVEGVGGDVLLVVFERDRRNNDLLMRLLC